MTRRIIAILLALVFGTGVCVSASADEATELQAEKQIVAEGGENASTGGKVQISQTIEPTGEENLFDVTLKVRTEQEIKETVSSDLAVCLIVDASGSMERCVHCGGYPAGSQGAAQVEGPCTCGNYESRQSSEVEGIRNLLDMLVSEYDKVLISTVIFGDNGSLLTDWFDISDESARESIAQQISDIPMKWGISTNLTEGLQISTNQMSSDKIANIAEYNRFSILMTDGVPYPYTGNEKTEGLKLAEKGTVISVYFESNIQSDNELVSSILAQFSTEMVLANDGESLKLKVTETTDTIKLLTEAWKVEADIGENLEYVELRSEDNGSVSCADGKLSWDLKKESPKKTTEGTKTYYEYEMTYRTRLKT